MFIVGPDINQMIIHNMSLLKRCRHISNLKCTKLIRVKYSVRRESELRLITDLIAYSLPSFDPRFQHLGRVVISTTKKYDKIKHPPSAVAAAAAGITTISSVSSPTEEGVREATS